MPAIDFPMTLPLDLAPQQCRAYEQLTLSIVQDTLAQYNAYSKDTQAQRDVDSRKWKLLKRRQNFKIYKSRGKMQPNVFRDRTHHNETAPTEARWAPLSKLICVGTANGSLEDAMYGTVTPTELSMATRSMSIQDEFVEHRVLYDIKLPTSEDPFEYLGLKWAVRASPISSIVKKRDLVFLEGSGFHVVLNREGHERLGYTVCHSVDRSEFGPTSGLVRGRMSMCSLYRQTAAGVIEVFVTLTTDPGGSMPPKLAARSASSALIAASRVMDSVVDRKLAWLYSKKSRTESTDAASKVFAVASAQGSHWCCLQCTRNLSSFASLSACQICSTTVCSRCLTTRKLLVGQEAASLAPMTVHVCVGCIASARRPDRTLEIAIDEFVLPEQHRKASVLGNESSHQMPLFMLTDLKAPRSPYSEQETRTEGSSTASSVAHCVDHDNDDDADEDDSDDDDDIIECEDLPDLSPKRASFTSDDKEKVRLWLQMNELRLQAEQTYRMTKEQGLFIQRSSPGDLSEATNAFSASAVVSRVSSPEPQSAPRAFEI